LRWFGRLNGAFLFFGFWVSFYLVDFVFLFFFLHLFGSEGVEGELGFHNFELFLFLFGSFSVQLADTMATGSNGRYGIRQ